MNTNTIRLSVTTALIVANVIAWFSIYQGVARLMFNEPPTYLVIHDGPVVETYHVNSVRGGMFDRLPEVYSTNVEDRR